MINVVECNDPPRRYDITTLITYENKFFFFLLKKTPLSLLMEIIVNLNFTNIYIYIYIYVSKHTPMFNRIHEY